MESPQLNVINKMQDHAKQLLCNQQGRAFWNMEYSYAYLKVRQGYLLQLVTHHPGSRGFVTEMRSQPIGPGLAVRPAEIDCAL